LRLFLHQLRSEQLLFWRSREAAVFIFVFPLLLFVLLGSVYDGTIDGEPASSVLLVGMLGYGAANTAFAGLAITLVLRRESALLKRLRATPLPAPTYLAAVLASTVIVFALQSAALVTLARVLFDADLPARVGSLLAALLLGIAAFAGMGFAATALIRSGEGASAALNVVLLPMAFVSGSFGPTRRFPDFLQALGEVLPLRHLIELLDAVALGGEAIWSRPGAIAVVTAWGVAGLAIAARRFRWEPREA
jgi:ABC-2 type transport system permease protein